MSVNVPDHDFLSNEHVGKKVEYCWCELFDLFEGCVHIPTLVVDFRCSQMAIFEWRWKASHTVSDGLTGDCDAPYKTSSLSSRLLAANSVSEPAKSITTVSHWSGFHWSCPSCSWKTPSLRKICFRRRIHRILNAWLWKEEIEVFELHDERLAFDPWWTIISICAERSARGKTSVQ